MKKKIAMILAIILCFAMMPAVFAEGENIKTYNTFLDIDGDGTANDTLTVDLDKYELIGDCTYFEQKDLVLTKPGFAVGYFACKNGDQTTGETIPIPYSVNYEAMICRQRYTEVEGVMTKVDEQTSADNAEAWVDNRTPDYVSADGGDFEWAYLEVTQEMIDAAGGAFEVVFVVRASMYPDTPIAELGQNFSDHFIHVYQRKPALLGNKDVTGTYIEGSSEHIPVYHVEITWGSMDFTYHAGDAGVWNTNTHTYDNVTASGWYCHPDADKITFTNNSNADVNISLNYIAAEGYEHIRGNFIDEAGDRIQSLILLNADNHEGENGAGMETTTACHLILAGELSEGDDSVVIGSIVVTLD